MWMMWMHQLRSVWTDKAVTKEDDLSIIYRSSIVLLLWPYTWIKGKAVQDQRKGEKKKKKSQMTVKTSNRSTGKTLTLDSRQQEKESNGYQRRENLICSHMCGHAFYGHWFAWMSTSVCHCELTEHKPLIYHTSLDTTYINSTEIPGEKHICCDKLCDVLQPHSTSIA